MKRDLLLFLLAIICQVSAFAQDEVQNPAAASGVGVFWKTQGNSNTDTSINFLGTIDSKPLTFRTSNIRRMTISQIGNVGIGTTVPVRALHIGTSGSTIRAIGFATGGGFINTPSAATDKLLFADANGDIRAITNGTSGQIMAINGSGVPAWTTNTTADWTTTGNAGTNNTNFIGTTDNRTFRFRTNNTERMFIDSLGKVGINLFTPIANTQLDMFGDIAWRESGFSFSGIDSCNNCVTSLGSFLRLEHSAGPVRFHGFANAHDGKIITLVNRSQHDATFSAESVFAADSNRIVTGAGSLVLSDTGGAIFQYSEIMDRWVLLSYTNGKLNGGTGVDWSLTGNKGTVDGTHFIGTTDNIPFNIRVNNKKAGRIDATNRIVTLGTVAGNSLLGTGVDNVFIGDSAGFSMTTSDQSTIVGSRAGRNTTVLGNSFFGYSAGKATTTGEQNSFFGSNAGEKNTTGILNCFFGILAGGDNTTGSINSYFGSNAKGDATIFNATAIGANATVAQSNSLVLGSISGINGSSATVNVGIGVTAPLERLQVAGKLLLTNGFSADNAALVYTDNTDYLFIGPRSGTTANGAAISLFGSANSSTGNPNGIDINTLAGISMRILSNGNVGLGTTTPQTRLDVNGALALRLGNTQILSSSTNIVTVGNSSYIRLAVANNTTTVVLTDGLQPGQILILECITGGGNSTDVANIIDDASNNNTNTEGDRAMKPGDTMTLLWNGTDWLELSYSDN